MKFVLIASGRFSKEQVCFDYFDKGYNNLTLSQGYQKSKNLLEKPSKFNEMIFLAEKLSKGIPHVRVDLYQSDEKIYFGEMTFFDSSGFEAYTDKNDDIKLGKWLELPNKTK